MAKKASVYMLRVIDVLAAEGVKWSYAIVGEWALDTVYVTPDDLGSPRSTSRAAHARVHHTKALAREERADLRTLGVRTEIVRFEEVMP